MINLQEIGVIINKKITDLVMVEIPQVEVVRTIKISDDLTDVTLRREGDTHDETMHLRTDQQVKGIEKARNELWVREGGWEGYERRRKQMMQNRFWGRR